MQSARIQHVVRVAHELRELQIRLHQGYKVSLLAVIGHRRMVGAFIPHI